MHSSLLSVLTWLPILGGIVVMLVGDSRASIARWLALGLAVAALVASVPLYTGFDTSTAALQFVERMPWIPSLRSDYYLGVDGISLPLILLTTFSTVLVVIAGWTVIEKRPAQYYAAFLIMEGLMIGVFSAADGLLFYLFWEAMLIPMFLIIGIWGGAAAHLRDDQVLPVHVPGLRVHAGRADLHVPEDRRLQPRGLLQAAADPARADR